MWNTVEMGSILGHFHSIENIIMGCKVSVRNIMRKTAFHTDSMDAALLYDSISSKNILIPEMLPPFCHGIHS